MSNPGGRAEWSKRNTRMAAILLALGALLRVVSFCISDNTGGDAVARVGITARWLQNPVFRVVFDAYLPLHFWLIALFSLVFHNVALAGRALSLVLGIASLFVVWLFARTLYGAVAGVFSLAVFAFYTLHIGYSTTSSAEVPYLFFLVGGLFFFFAYLEGKPKNLWHLGFSGLSLSCAAAIRYEAWVILFYLGLALCYFVLWVNRSEPVLERLKKLVVFGFTGALWPLFVMFYSWRATGDPLRSLHVHNQEVTAAFVAHPVSLAYQLVITPLALVATLSPLAFLAAIYGLFRSFTSRVSAAFAGLILFFAAVQTYEVMTGKLLAMARYSLTLGTFLSIVAGVGLEAICDRVTFPKRRIVMASILAFLATNFLFVLLMSEVRNPLSDKFASLSPRLRYPTRVAQVGQYLRTHMSASDAVVIDNYNAESNVVADAAGFPAPPGDRAYLANAKNSVTVRDYVANQKPRFLVYSDRGTLFRLLTVPPGCSGTSTIDGITFRCVFSNEIYRVYELNYP